MTAWESWGLGNDAFAAFQAVWRRLPDADLDATRPFFGRPTCDRALNRIRQEGVTAVRFELAHYVAAFEPEATTVLDAGWKAIGT